MGLSSNYNNMLNEVLSYDLLMEEMGKQCWLLNNANIKKDYDGSKIIVPFVSAIPSSVSMGALPATNDIAPGAQVRGEITSLPKAYGSLRFFEEDLIFHGKVSKANFLRLLPDQLEQLMKFMKSTISTMVLNTGEMATATGTGEADGDLQVSNTERFRLGQKVTIEGTGSTVTGYVGTINKNTNVIRFYTTRTGTTGVDLSSNVVATDKIYPFGGASENFSSLAGQILPAADGGDTNIFGVTKLSSPYTQAVSYDGSSITSSNLLSTLFDALVTARQKDAMPTKFLCSYKHLGTAMKILETQAGAFKNVNRKVSYAGYTEIDIASVTGEEISLVGIQEMSDSNILGINPKYLDFHCAPHSFMDVIESPEGLKYYTVRDDVSGSSTGYSYVTDFRLAGEFAYRAPWSAVAIHTISY